MNAQRAPQEPEKPDLPPEIEELAPAVALGAADADEAAAFLRGLTEPATRQAAAAALAPYAELADLLLYGAAPVAAPPGSEARLRAAVAGAAAVGRAGPTAAGQAARPGRAWHWSKILAAAALLAGALLLLFNLYWMREAGALRTSHMALQQQLDDQAADFAARLADQARTLEQQKAQIAAQDALLAQFVTSESERYTMKAVEPGGRALAQVAWLDAANTAVLRAEGFPPLPEGQAYQLWLIRGDQRTSGGLFTVDDAGCGTLIFHPTESLEAFDGMGITPEPAVGSPGPTAPPVVRAQL